MLPTCTACYADLLTPFARFQVVEDEAYVDAEEDAGPVTQDEDMVVEPPPKRSRKAKGSSSTPRPTRGQQKQQEEQAAGQQQQQQQEQGHAVGGVQDLCYSDGEGMQDAPAQAADVGAVSSLEASDSGDDEQQQPSITLPILPEWRKKHGDGSACKRRRWVSGYGTCASLSSYRLCMDPCTSSYMQECDMVHDHDHHQRACFTEPDCCVSKLTTAACAVLHYCCWAGNYIVQYPFPFNHIYDNGTSAASAPVLS